VIDPHNVETQDMPQACVPIEYLLSVLISELQALIHELRIQNARSQAPNIKQRQHLFIGALQNDAQISNTPNP